MHELLRHFVLTYVPAGEEQTNLLARLAYAFDNGLLSDVLDVYYAVLGHHTNSKVQALALIPRPHKLPGQ